MNVVVRFTLSMTPKSVENLFMMRPRGVVSKKRTGQLMRPSSITSCKYFLALAPQYCPTQFDINERSIEAADSPPYMIKYFNICKAQYTKLSLIQSIINLCYTNYIRFPKK